MSSPYILSRKRRPNFRQDDLPPLKQKKKTVATKYSMLVGKRLRDFADWITDLEFKRFFHMAVETSVALPEETIDIDEDDDIIPIEEDDDEEEDPFSEKFEKTQRLINHRRQKRELELNGHQSRYPTRGRDVDVIYDSRYYNNGSPPFKPRHSVNDVYNLRLQKKDKVYAPISNPDADVEVLLDSSPKPSISEADDIIEIISEIPPSVKPKPESRALTRLKLIAAACSKPKRSSCNYTAHEVVRLQEKAQYQLLLEKYMSGNFYQPSAVKRKDAEVQVDPKNFVSGSHFQKEILNQPVNNFLEKYCKPCQLLPAEKPRKCNENEVIEEITIEDDDEEDLEIVDVKLPTFKPHYTEDVSFYSSSWMSELRKNVNLTAKERLKIVKEQEKRLEKYRRERILGQLKSGIEINEAKEPELPALTSEMEEIVDKALIGDPTERLCKITSDYLHRKDIETLDGLSWLNDLVINSYLDLIVMRSKQEGYPSVYTYNTFFYTTLKSKKYQSVRRWTRKVDIFSFDLNFIPIHLGVHWCLGVIDHRVKKICYYDSMGSGEDQCLDVLHEYLCCEYKDKKGTYMDPNSYTCEVMKEIPQQMNGSDCGMFALKYAEYISRDEEITFSQKDMQYFRRRMVYELITGKIL